VSVAQHLPIVPILLPLATGAALLLVNERRLALKSTISVASATALLASAIALVAHVDASSMLVYRLGDWAAPFGIVLAADALSALLVLLASMLGWSALVFSTARWERAGPRFHALVQFMVMGVNGAFLTGDLFNLFVFFEVLLAASYGLALHGAGSGRVRAGLHYITVNLTASLLFLLGASLVYGVTGTLNMADLSMRIPGVPPADRALLEAGAALLGIAFLTKAGMWPLNFWLPPTYSAAAAPAAALFAVLTKVGVYVVMRTGLLFFGDDGSTSAGFGGAVLVAGGMATLAFGAIGVLASQDLPRLASYSLIVSAGTLLAATGMGRADVTSAALYYLVASTLGVAALYLLTELIERGRAPGADILSVTAEAFVEPEDVLEQEEEVGIAIPATIAVLGVSFACCALVLAGLPPLAGFIGKFALLDALLRESEVSAASWAMFALLIASGLAAIIGLGRAGVRRFWAATDNVVPRVRVIEIAPVVILLALCAALTVEAGAVMRYLESAAAALHDPRPYIDHVLRSP
jgi:multicomponent K+:H+ antiporter subunit D